MTAPLNRRDEIENLIEESYEIESLVSPWQEIGEVTAEQHKNVEAKYVSWYSRSLTILPDSSVEEFKNMYEGGVFVKRIKSFIASPLAINQFYVENGEMNFLSKWQHPFETAFSDSFKSQRTILQAAIYAAVEIAPVLNRLAEVFARFPEYLQVLQGERNENVPPLIIKTEADLQVLVHAALRLIFNDVRPEDYVPQHAGARSRVDFLLREEGVVVETKMTREGLADRKVGEELLIDWGRYARHPDCRGIFAIVYDPARYIKNAVALQSDLSQNERNPATRVIVVR